MVYYTYYVNIVFILIIDIDRIVGITFFGHALRLWTLYALVLRPAVARREHGQPGVRVALQVDHFVFARYFAPELDCEQI